MRVIAGSARGRQLKTPRARPHSARAEDLRPTSDLMRGAIFSSLASLGADMSRVLDLYAGTGALGIEALSRGASRCDFVERDRAACELIRENLHLTGLSERARVFCLPARKALTELDTTYTLVLADPPYDDKEALEVLGSLGNSPLIAKGLTVVVMEHSARNEPPGEMGLFTLIRSRRHGDSAVSVYR